jgi:hypothetical protein
MKLKFYLLLFFVPLILTNCQKQEETEDSTLPPGAIPFTADEVAFVPYTSTNLTFKKAPDFTEELILGFIERKATEEVFAWDQTNFHFGSDPYLNLEFRLRYLQTETTAQKTLAIYMPYWDDAGVIRSNVFEMPLVMTDDETNFFQSLVTFHESIDLNGTVWTDVFEIKPLLSTEESMDSETNFEKIFYNKTAGLIQMNQKNGDNWMIFP